MEFKVKVDGIQQDIRISDKLFAKTKELANDGKIDAGEINQLLRLAGDKGNNSTLTHDEAIFLATLKNEANVGKIHEGTSESNIELSLTDDSNLPEMDNLTKLKGKGLLKELGSREKELALQDNKVWTSGMKGALEKYSQVSLISCVTSSFMINTLMNHDDSLRVIKGMNRELNNLMSKSDDQLKATFSSAGLHSKKQLENWQDFTLAPILAKVMASPPQPLNSDEIKNLDMLFTHLNNYEKPEDILLLAGKSSMLETVEGLDKKIGPDPEFQKQLKEIKSALNSNKLPLAAKLLSESIDVKTGGGSSVTVFDNSGNKQHILFSEDDILPKKYGFNSTRPTQQEVESLAGNDKTKIAGVFEKMKDGEVLRLVEGDGKQGHSVNIRRIGENFLFIDPMSHNRNLNPISSAELADRLNQSFKIDNKVQMNPEVNL
jgi:hypothetical protein